MDPTPVAMSQWERVKAIFDASLELPTIARPAYLDSACAGDAALLNEVRSLLESHKEAGDFIEVVPSGLPAGSSIGPYRIVQVIGEGGMGTVYQAVRSDDLYRKLVALKVIRTGVYDQLTRNKFNIERQILAHLDHPNIAKLLDGGVTPDGQPYFVMDYIAGTPLDVHCDQEKLSILGRLKLFLTVCSAVHYAHQNLVVHRDLKPQNILVIPESLAPEGSLRLLDFGIAKLIDPDDSPIGFTASVVQMMTPEYASPEQLKNAPVTTGSDVYSLGVLLFLLLTGQKPYEFPSRAPLDVWKTICETEPVKPSTAVRQGTPEQASNRGLKQERLARLLCGDLDNIVLMALRKEPERRYASVEQFARDINRYLEGLPVMARQDTVRYRATKFILRHWTGVLASVFVVLTLVAAIIVTSYQAHVAVLERAAAQARFNDVRDLANAVLFDLHDAIEPLPGSTKARELLVKKAQQYLDKLAGDRLDPSLEQERARAYERIGDVLGLATQSNLGQTGEALASYQKALGIELALARNDPGDLRHQRDLARTYSRVCLVQQSAGQYDAAVANCYRAIEIGQRLSSARPKDPATRGELAATYQNLAGAYAAQGQWEKSKEVRVSALQEFQNLHNAHPDQFAFSLAVAYLRLSTIQEQLKEFSAARENADRSVAIFEDTLRKHPGDIRAKLNTTFALQRVGSVLSSMGDLPGALREFQKVLPIREALLASDPVDARARINLANSHAALGATLFKMGRFDAAFGQFEKQRSLAEALTRSDALHVDYQISLAEALENIGLVEARQGPLKKPHARECLNAALEIYDGLDRRKAIPAEYVIIPGRLRSELAQLDK